MTTPASIIEKRMDSSLEIVYLLRRYERMRASTPSPHDAEFGIMMQAFKSTPVDILWHTLRNVNMDVRSESFHPLTRPKSTSTKELTIAHSPQDVITPPSTGIFNIPWTIDGTACNFLTLGLPIIPLYGDGDLTTSKFIQDEVEWSSSPIFTISCICPTGHIISPLNPIKGMVAGINWFLISRRRRLKQCSYNISEADPPSTYMRCMQWPPISASIIIGPSIPSSSPKGGKEISGLGEKLCVIFCLATLSQG
ncbi:hypothetical protein Tco_1549141 [Tanacetum coccineum]